MDARGGEAHRSYGTVKHIQYSLNHLESLCALFKLRLVLLLHVAGDGFWFTLTI